jgi:HEAT repeat protein
MQKLLENSDWNLRAWAADSLWRDKFEPNQSLASLVTALGDSNATVRDRAAQSLGKIHCDDPAAAEALRTALENELRAGGNEIVQWKIITSLGQLGPTARSSIPLLTNLMTSTNHSGVLAVIALSQIELQEPRWITALISRLGQGENAQLRVKPFRCSGGCATAGGL